MRELRREGKTQPEPFSIDDSEDEDTVEEVKSEAEETQIRLDLKSRLFPEAKRMNVRVTTISRAIFTAYLKAVGVDPAKRGSVSCLKDSHSTLMRLSGVTIWSLMMMVLVVSKLT